MLLLFILGQVGVIVFCFGPGGCYCFSFWAWWVLAGWSSHTCCSCVAVPYLPEAATGICLDLMWRLRDATQPVAIARRARYSSFNTRAGGYPLALSSCRQYESSEGNNCELTHTHSHVRESTSSVNSQTSHIIMSRLPIQKAAFFSQNP